MGNVDILDKMIHKYWRNTNYISLEHALTSFFIHVCIHQAFIASNHYFNLEFSDRNQLKFRINLLNRIIEEYTHDVKKEKHKHGQVNAKLSRKERKTCKYELVVVRTKQLTIVVDVVTTITAYNICLLFIVNY